MCARNNAIEIKASEEKKPEKYHENGGTSNNHNNNEIETKHHKTNRTHSIVILCELEFMSSMLRACRFFFL